MTVSPDLPGPPRHRGVIRTEPCPVCGAHIDMTFASQDMNDFCITKTSGEQAELRVRYVCNYCRIGFEHAETLPISTLRTYSENQGFDR